MRKLLFAFLLVLGCGEGDLPCVTCNEPPPPSYNEYGYCRYYSGNSYSCSYMSVYNCNGTNYGNDNTCGNGGYYQPSSSSSYRPSSSSAGLAACSGGTVTIGSQVWQKCNSNAVPSTGSSRCYGNDDSNCAIYGRLYDWAAAMALSASCNSTSCSSQIGAKHRGICPSGWHIPSNADWDALTTYIESNKGCTSCDAKHLKSTSGWYNNGNGLDSYAFSALPGGYGSSDGYFSNVGNYGLWWSSSESSSNGAYYRGMTYFYEGASWNTNDKSYLFSVRCLQD